MKKEKMIHLRVDDELKEMLKKEASEKRLTIVSLIRTILINYFKKE